MARRRHLGRNLAIAGLAGLVLALALLFVLVGSPAPSYSSSTHTPQPAGRNPSKSARMVCAHEAQHDIDGVLGVQIAAPPAPTWVDHLYSCRYVYANGSMLLSVKELSSAPATTAYFTSLRTRLGDRTTLHEVGQGAFVTRAGSVVVRKDYKVLLVDTSSLPARFGARAESRADVAADVSITILGCWSGA